MKINIRGRACLLSLKAMHVAVFEQSFWTFKMLLVRKQSVIRRHLLTTTRQKCYIQYYITVWLRPLTKNTHLGTNRREIQESLWLDDQDWNFTWNGIVLAKSLSSWNIPDCVQKCRYWTQGTFGPLYIWEVW